MLTLKELASQTGLSVNIVRKYLRLFGPFLKPYIKRGPSNKLLFDPNCVVIFGEVKKQKDDGKTAKEIVSYLKESCTPSQELSYHKIASEQPGQTKELSQSTKELYQNLLDEKDKRIHERDERDLNIVRLEIQNIKLREAMRILPKGKSPGRMKREWERRQKVAPIISGILNELRNLSSIRFLKRKKLLSELEDFFISFAD